MRVEALLLTRADLLFCDSAIEAREWLFLR